MAAALLWRNSILVIGSRDFRTLQEILLVLDPTTERQEGLKDFSEIDWYREYFSTLP